MYSSQVFWFKLIFFLSFLVQISIFLKFSGSSKYSSQVLWFKYFSHGSNDYFFFKFSSSNKYFSQALWFKPIFPFFALTQVFFSSFLCFLVQINISLKFSDSNEYFLTFFIRVMFCMQKQRQQNGVLALLKRQVCCQ